MTSLIDQHLSMPFVYENVRQSNSVYIPYFDRSRVCSPNV